MGALLAILLTFVLGLLSAKLYGETRARNALAFWLKESGRGELPDGSGAWREIFTAQQRLQKEQRREVALLRVRLERYLRATEVLPDGVLLLDAGDRIEWLNAAATQHFALDPRRDRGTLISQLVRQPAFISYLADFRAGRNEGGERLTIGLDDAGRSLSIELLRFAEQGALMVSRDISDIVRTERMRRDFVANVSHELRTPVTVIAGFLEQLTGDTPPQGDEAKHFLGLMADQAKRMSTLVEDLLTLSRLEGEARPAREAEVDLPALLAAVLAEGRALSGGRHQVVCSDDCAQTPTLVITGSADELRSAFGNLMSNAIRYTPEGGTVSLRWFDHEGSACVSVTDSGIGIAPEHLPRLTERFYRVDRGRSAATGGTGLGLAIVKHVLARHQARLDIQSVPGRGSCFTICFPAERLLVHRHAESIA